MKKPKLEKFLNESSSMLILFTGLKIQKQLNENLREHDLNLNQALILLAIYFEPEKTIRWNNLAELFQMSKGNISHSTSALEEKKLISRKLIQGDLRGFEYQLTPKGSKLSLVLIKFFDKLETNVDQTFGLQELKSLNSVLKRFMETSIIL